MTTPTPTTPSLAPPPTIKIADDLHHTRSETVYHPPTRPDPGTVGGIYHTRTISRASFDRRTEFSGNNDAEEGDQWHNNDVHKKQVFHGRTLLWLAYQSIGVIYGDIGTSPLYVFSSTFTNTPTHSDLLQVLSIVIWSLTMVVTVKYVIIVLHADNDGEGGTFSCYSLLTRYAHLTERDPREQVTVRMHRALSQDLRPTNRNFRARMEKSKFVRGLLKTIGVLAVSMVMSDGVLTPAQSVLGAVQGLNVVSPNMSSSTVVGVSCAILILLFMIQPLGITKLASTFAPIVILWLALNGGFGIYNLVNYDWSVLKAFSPYYVFEFFIDKKTDGWRMLGGVLLAFTGVEALFADLGAFSMSAIQLSWLCWAYPCLLLGYVGQAAYISRHPEAYTNPFFNSVPPGMLIPSLVVAILAAIVASQAIITATFQLISQIMKLSYCPQVKVVHTSKTFHGQLFVPFLNWLLMCGTILVTAVYSNTTRLGDAYGVCVMFVTFFDTCMVTLVALLVWQLPVYIVIIPWLVLGCIDGLFLTSALLKVPDGAWFTLTLSTILASLFLLWRFGKENQWKAEAEDRIKPTQLVKDCAVNDGTGTETGARILQLAPRWGGDTLATIRGFGIFFDKTGVLTPAVFTHFVTKFVAVPDVTVFFHLHPVEMPTVPEGERFAVTRFVSIPGCYRLVVRHGFMDEVLSPDLAALIYEQVRKFVIRQAREKEAVEEAVVDDEEIENDNSNDNAQAANGDEEKKKKKKKKEDGGSHVASASAGSGSGSASSPAVPSPLPIELRDEKVAGELARLDRAYAAKILYVVGKEQMRIRSTTALPRRVALSVFLWIRDNTRAKIANLRLAMDRIVEVGFIKEL